MNARTERDFSKLLLGVTMEPQLIGQRIKEARLRRGWTQLDFALIVHSSISAVQRWERGELPRVKTLFKVAEILDVPVDDLVETDPPPATATYAEIMAELAALRGDVAKLLADREKERSADDGAPERPATPRPKRAAQ